MSKEPQYTQQEIDLSERVMKRLQEKNSAAKYLQEIKEELEIIPKERRRDVIELMLKESSIPLFMTFHSCELTTHMTAVIDFEGNKYVISFSTQEYAAQEREKEAVGFEEVKARWFKESGSSTFSPQTFKLFHWFNQNYAIYLKEKGGEGL